jgi:Flp pilus assembly protein TadD
VTPARTLSKTGRPILDTSRVVIHHYECLKRGGSSFIREKQELRLRAELLRARRPPYERDAFLNAAKTLFTLERDSEAMRLLARAVKRYPLYADAHRLWGLIELEQGNLPSARRRFQAAVFADAQSADAWAMLGVACVESGQNEPARRALLRALQLQPGHLVARNSLGVLYEDLGRTGDACREYRAALKLHPGFAPARTNLARLLKSH